MAVLLDTPVTAIGVASDQAGQTAGRPLAEWNDAYEMVESYFRALRVRNKFLRGQLVIHVLQRAMRKADSDTQHSTTIELAVQEMDNVVNEWFAKVLDAHSSEPDD